MKTSIDLIFIGLVILSSPLLGQEEITVFTNANVITMSDDQVYRNQTVVVMDGKISFVGQTNTVEGAQVIDATGKYLVPGIAEMHAHIPVPEEDSDDTYVRETLFLYLSNGITTIRGMLGNPYHLELKKQITTGEILSPRVYTSSPSLNGNTIPDQETAIDKVTQYKNDGYDFLKIHPGIKRDVFDAMASTADEVGIRFAGHVPNEVGIKRALEAKYASIDHLDGYVHGLVADLADPNSGGFFGFDLVDQADESLIVELANTTKVQNVWIVPTQTLFTRWLAPDPKNEMMQSKEIQYMPSKTRYAWAQSHQNMTSQEDYSPEKHARFVEIRNEIMKGLHAAGVRFLLGSDAPQVMNVPGFSIQHEMQDMADAGFTNFEILQSGTTNVAEYFGEKGTYGQISVGASADLILLEANPLEDIKHMSQIAGVMVRGHWLSSSDITGRLAEIALAHQ